MADAFTRAKLVLLDQAMRDRDLPPSARVVFYEITQHINRVSGSAWPSQGRLADRLGLDLTTVKRAVAKLRAAGYVEIEKTGRHNNYRPVLNRQPIGGNLPPIGGAQTGAHGEKQGANRHHYRGQNEPCIGGKMHPLSSLSKPHKEIFPNRDHHQASFQSRAREAPATSPVGSTLDGLSRKDDGAIHLLLINEIGCDVVDALHAIDEGRPLKMLTAARRERPLTVIELDHARKLIEGTLHTAPKRAAS